jgi:WhiB family redox-sensing transcriptional regulator
MKAGVAMDPEHDGAQGRTREAVAPAIGMSQAQWGRLKHIGDKAADGDEAAVEVLDEIDAGAGTSAVADTRHSLGSPTGERRGGARSLVTPLPYAALMDDLDDVEALVSLPPGDIPGLPLRPAWMDEGACLGMDPEDFYPERPVAKAAVAAAREVCARCPVAEPCLEWALEHDEAGVWAGTTEAQRQAMRRRAAA